MKRAKELASNARPSLPSFGMLKDKVGIKRVGSLEDIAKPQRTAAVRQRSITDFSDVKLRALNELASRFQNSTESDQSNPFVEE